MSQEGFWDSADQATKVVKELKGYKVIVEPWDAALKKIEELQEILPLLKPEDKELILEVWRSCEVLAKELEALEFKTLLGGKLDKNNAIISVNSGAGGTESCVWAGLLFRMYSRFSKSRG